MSEMIIFTPDDTIEGADWIKNRKGGWDLPPYGSPEFLELIGGPQYLESFKQTPAYKAACANGLINDDEWVADWVEPAGDDE